MSLKSMLNGKSNEDKEFQEIIFKNLPQRAVPLRLLLDGCDMIIENDEIFV